MSTQPAPINVTFGGQERRFNRLHFAYIRLRMSLVIVILYDNLTVCFQYPTSEWLRE